MSRKRGGGGGGVGGRGAESNCNYGKNRGIEENTLAILENSSSATIHHLLDDRNFSIILVSFLFFFVVNSIYILIGNFCFRAGFSGSCSVCFFGS